MTKGGTVHKVAETLFMNRWFFPFWSAWVVFFYIYGILILTLAGTIASLPLILGLFLPIPVFEWWATGRFMALHTPSGKDLVLKKRIWHWLFNVALWVLFYGVFEVYVFLKTGATPGFKVYNTIFLIVNFLLWRSVMGYVWVALAYWLIMYLVLPVRMGRLRLLTALFLPLGITVIIFLVQWKIGGAGAASDAQILSQPGVTKVLDFEEIHQALIRDYPDNLKYLVPKGSGNKTRGKIIASNKVREVLYDQDLNAIFAFFGGTYYLYGTTTIPAIVKKDLTTGEVTYLLTEHNVRKVEPTENSIFVAPWHDNHVYEISKKDLSIIRSIPVGNYVEPMLWEPMDMALDQNKKYLYLTTSMYPSLVTVDLETNRQTGVLPLYGPGTIGEGGWAWCLSQSRKTRHLYMIAYSDKFHNIVEVDPDKNEIVQPFDCGQYSQTAMIFTPEEDAVYCQSAIWNVITKVGLHPFKVEKTLKGDLHSRCLTLDPKRNVIYVLGYCSGKLSAVDLDTGERLWEIPVGGRPHGMYPDSMDRLWIHSMSGVYRLDLPVIWKQQGPATRRSD